MTSKLPVNHAIEKLFLSIILSDEKLLSEHIYSLEPKDFNHEKLKAIFQSSLSLMDKKIAIDFHTIKNEAESILGIEIENNLLFEIYETKVNPNKVESYIKILKEKSLRRQLIRDLTLFLNDAYGKVPTGELLRNIFDGIYSFELEDEKDLIISNDQIRKKRWEYLEERASMDKDYPKTGFVTVDKHLSEGFAKGKLSVIAGRVSMGKTSYKINIMNNLANNGYKIASFCLEQDFQSEMDKLQSLRTQIELSEIKSMRKWRYDDPRFEKLDNDLKKIEKSDNLNFFDKGYYYLQDIYKNLIQLKHRIGNIDIVFIDLFDRVADVSVTQNKPMKINNCLRILSNKIAEEIETHFCLIVQISRKAVDRKIKRPRISDLKDSGAFDEYSDLVFMLHRDSYYDEDSGGDDGSDTELIIGKQRDGSRIMSIPFNFEMDICKFWEEL